MTAEEVRTVLQKACDDAGSAAAWARQQRGLSSQYVRDVLKGRRTPGPAICAALRIESVTIYRSIGDK